MQNAPMYPFEAGTRRRRRTLNALPFVDSQTVSDKLPNTGYAARLDLEVTINFSTTAAVNFAGDAIYKLARAIAKNVWIQTSQNAQVVKASAFGLYLLSFMDTVLNTHTGSYSTTSVNAPTGAGNQTFRFRIAVPIAYNLGLNWDLGLLNLQNDDIRIDYGIDWGSVPGLFDVPGNVTASSVQGYVTPILTYYDVPPVTQFTQPDLSHIVKIAEQEESLIVGTGDHRIRLPRGNSYASMVHFITDGGVAATTFQPYTNTAGKLKNYELRMQGSTSDESLPVWFLEQEARLRYGIYLPQGALAWDGTYDTDQPGRFQLGYNVLDTSQFTELDAYVNVQNINAANSKVLTVRREIVELSQ